MKSMAGKWTAAILFAAMAAAGASTVTNADDPSKNTDSDSQTKSDSQSSTKSKSHAFLGVMVEEIHPSLASHLSGFEFKGQGLIVEDIGEDSPAAKAGLKQHDILMNYDDQKLFAPAQLLRLVGRDHPGRSVTLKLIRQGKSQDVKVELGERPADWGNPHEEEHHHFSLNWPKEMFQQHQGQMKVNDSHPFWTGFDSLTLKKLDKDRFHASIAFTDKAGNVRKHEYEGTHEEISKQINEDKELLPNERTHLLRGLDAPDQHAPFLLDDEGPEF